MSPFLCLLSDCSEVSSFAPNGLALHKPGSTDLLPISWKPSNQETREHSLSKPFLSSFCHHHEVTGKWRFSARTAQNRKNHIISWASHKPGNHRSPGLLLPYIHLREHQVWSCDNIVYSNNDNSILSLVKEHGILFLWMDVYLCTFSLGWSKVVCLRWSPR